MNELKVKVGTNVTWQRLTGDLFIAIDRATSGLVGFQKAGKATLFDSPSSAFVVVGGREVNGWIDIPGNNLVGDRSNVLVGHQEISLDSEPTAISQLDKGVEVVRVVDDFEVIEQWIWLRGSTLSRYISISWKSSPSLPPIREAVLLAPSIEPRGQVLSRFVGMAAAAGWTKLNIEDCLSEDLTASAGVSATVPLMADVGSATVGIKSSSKSVLIGLASMDYAALAEIVNTGLGLACGHRIKSASLRSAGSSSLSIATQVLTLDESIDDLGAGIRSNLPRTSNTPDWLRAATIYEVHIGNKFPDPFKPNDFEGKNPYPTVAALVNDLDRIKEMGFDVIQLMPLFPFPGYTILDYARPGDQYGGDEVLTELVTALERFEMKLVVDFILHGPVDKSITAYAQWAPIRSRYLDEHPEWFMQNEAGEIRKTHTYSFDLANQQLQNHIIAAMLQLVRMGVAGFRVDAPLWNLFPNWDESIDYPAGSSTMGWIDLLNRLRDSAAAAGLELGLIGETAGIAAAATFDTFYGYEEMGLLRSFADPKMPFLAMSLLPQFQQNGSTIRGWLEEKSRLLGPDGFSRTIRHLDSHDSYEWGSLSTVSSNLFWQSHRALLVALATLPGPWMHFCGAEIGVEDAISEAMAYRKHPAVATGEIDFAASVCNAPEVFQFVSHSGRDVQLVVANLSEKQITADIHFVSPLLHRLKLIIEKDGGARMRQNDCQITIEPWGYRVFQSAPQDEGVSQ